MLRRKFFKQIIALGALPLLPSNILYASAPASPPTLSGVSVLEGPHIHLTIAKQVREIQGLQTEMILINNSLPAPIIRCRERDKVTIRVTNTLSEVSSIHWHGLIVPSAMDGVPGLSFNGIQPDQTFEYSFPLNQHGTYWYHSHSGFQELLGVYGAFIIDSTKAKPQQEVVILLSDATVIPPSRLLHELRINSERLSVIRDRVQDYAENKEKFAMWNAMAMSPFDLSDTSTKVFTYLCNGLENQQQPTHIIQPGQPTRIRVINASSSTIFDIQIPDLEFAIIGADGNDIEAVSVHEFRIAPAETYDLFCIPKDRPYCFFAQSIERTGFAHIALTPEISERAPIPILDRPVTLAMNDMMGDMESERKPISEKKPIKKSYLVESEVEYANYQLDDPGVGLRDRDWKVLTYADLHTIDQPIFTGEIEDEIILRLTGNMHRYLWNIDGVEFAKAEPIRLAYKKLYRVTLHNDTMMSHPMHLHGLWSNICKSDGTFIKKHTLLVQGAKAIEFIVDADTIGRWAFHCHLALHMKSGMFREFRVT
ncbi:MAG: multicopper oxidase domain-containing protein [Methylacidiphilales bacterium]|nr:multicopper oxidase domain-containing protein [Candidatus Methylacidiphilales bacterium]